LLAFQFGFAGDRGRISQSTYVRWALASVTVEAAKDYLPFGNGAGTLFRSTSAANRWDLYRSFISAHNDWMESWLEGGLASAAVVCALVACYVFLAYRSWRTADPNSRLVAYGRAGSICVGLLLAHSIVDYPLRTTALMVMVAISCAFMLRAHLEKATTSVARTKPPLEAGQRSGRISPGVR
jgi:O-antigen ligase